MMEQDNALARVKQVGHFIDFPLSGDGVCRQMTKEHSKVDAIRILKVLMQCMLVFTVLYRHEGESPDGKPTAKASTMLPMTIQ